METSIIYTAKYSVFDWCQLSLEKSVTIWLESKTFPIVNWSQIRFVSSICPTPRLATIQDSDQSEEDLPGPSQFIPPGEHQQQKGVSLSSLEEQQRQYEKQVKRLEVEIQLLEDEIERRDRPMDSATDEEVERAM